MAKKKAKKKKAVKPANPQKELRQVERQLVKLNVKLADINGEIAVLEERKKELQSAAESSGEGAEQG